MRAVRSSRPSPSDLKRGARSRRIESIASSSSVLSEDFEHEIITAEVSALSLDVPKAGLYQRGLLKSLMTWAIPTPTAEYSLKPICRSLFLLFGFCRHLLVRLTPVKVGIVQSSVDTAAMRMGRHHSRFWHPWNSPSGL